MLRRDRIAVVGARWHWLIPIGVIFALLTPILFRDEALHSSVRAPRGWYAPLQFADRSAPVVRPNLPALRFQIDGRQDSYTTVEVRAGWGLGVTVGRWVTVASLLLALAAAGVYLASGRRRRKT